MGEIRPLGLRWRQVHLKPEIQRFTDCEIPEGYGVLYCIARRTGTEKAYLGIHSGSNLEKYKKLGARCRYNKHLQGSPSRSPTVIHRAMKKHGSSAFEFFIVDIVPVQELAQLEIDSIAKYGTLVPNGYNVSMGGETGPGPDAFARISETRKTESYRTAHSESITEMWNKMSEDDKQARADKVRETRALFTDEKKELRSKKFSQARRRPEVMEKSRETGRRVWSDTDTRARIKKSRRETDDRKMAERLELAKKTALPYEPRKANRVQGAYYHRLDGTIGICDSSKKVTQIGVRVREIRRGRL